MEFHRKSKISIRKYTSIIDKLYNEKVRIGFENKEIIIIKRMYTLSIFNSFNLPEKATSISEKKKKCFSKF